MDQNSSISYNDEFLQSEYWRKFQESVGKKTFCISGEDFNASIIEHSLQLVGKYFYIPRGPVIKSHKSKVESQKLYSKTKTLYDKLINLAKENGAGWIRIEPQDSEDLEIIKENWRVVKAPHDVQPRELFIIDITKSEEELLVEMKPKTRYNIKLAQKRGVDVKSITNDQDTNSKKYIDRFIELTRITAKRDGITPHLDEYYRKMFETIPSDIIKLYIAEYEGEVITVNVMLFYDKTATYIHGASSNKHRNVMAPFLLQWQAIQDAKRSGFEKYDFGGVRTFNIQHSSVNNDWAGITRFKTGFSPQTSPTVFPGCWDIILNPFRYKTYKVISKIKGAV